MLEKAVIIKGDNIGDLSDLLRIARSIGKNILHCTEVNVNPHVFFYDGEYIVKVSRGR